jgi:methyl-accepting chemotaxis protein
VLLAISRMETAANGALRGARGYLVTGDPSFLAPYERGRSDGEAELGRLRVLTRDNGVQQRNLAQAGERLNSYLATVAAEVALEGEGPPHPRRRDGRERRRPRADRGRAGRRRRPAARNRRGAA